MDDNFVFPTLNTSNEITHIIETYEEKDPELKEMKITLRKVKELTHFLYSPVSSVEFDICIQGIKNSVDEMRKLLNNVEEILHTECWTERKVRLYKQDIFLLRKLEQFFSLFPIDGERLGEKLIEDKAARQLWKNAFGNEFLIVPWSTFFHAFEKTQNRDLKDDEKAIKSAIDFTHDNFVTPYEFNVFLQWFGPLDGCVDRFLKPLRAGILCGFVPAIEANELLKTKEPGTYLIRFSKTQVGSFAVTYVDARQRIKHTILHSVPGGVTLKNPPQTYKTLTHFARAHSSKLRFPIGTKWSYEKSSSINGVQVLKEMEKEHKAIKGLTGSGGSNSDSGEDNSCVVCMDKPIATVFLECGHLACCKSCSKKLSDCPVCRQPISRVVPVFRT